MNIHQPQIVYYTFIINFGPKVLGKNDITDSWNWNFERILIPSSMSNPIFFHVVVYGWVQ